MGKGKHFYASINVKSIQWKILDPSSHHVGNSYEHLLALGVWWSTVHEGSCPYGAGGGADNKHKNKIHLDSVSHRKKIKGGK